MTAGMAAPVPGEGHVDDVEAGHLLEDLAGEMVRAADAGRGIEHLPGFGARERDVLLQRVGRHRRMHDQDHRVARQQRDRREILQRIVGHRHAHMGRDDQRGFGGHQERVAVRLGLGHRVGADPPGRAGAVLDVERLAVQGRQVRLQHARDQVGAAARRKRHDDAHRSRLRDARRRGQHGGAREPGAGSQAANEGAAGRKINHVHLR